ncbi:cobyrinate a,c-diamide synthase [Desulforamulus aquiferis]|uniref:Cobyrinate a,c-diamide synthase n=1 Tax=Desulforamulus aquiferis TaxID=1397668 RepID=A0AAW7ZC44_9FIRM|nr:cobyrinate a,c-diamide synthase [Desulforamulus aquiferis]
MAGTHSGVGKTTLTLGLLAALRLRGLNVQPYKVGPDYIDTGLHKVAAGMVSHNLDSWMGSPEAIQSLFQKHSATSELSLIEGVMGLYDGARGQGEVGSTAQVAKILRTPVVLVFSAKGLARSAAALVAGYRHFDPNVNLVGVIANGVGSQRHVDFIQEVIEGELGLPLLGALKEDKGISMPARQLGLLPAEENKDLQQALIKLAAKVEDEINIDRLISLAQGAGDFPLVYPENPSVFKTKVTLGVARDKAFNFYYQDSLDYLKELGAEIHWFSPLEDSHLPANIKGIYLGGGFPEEFLPTLAANKALLADIKQAAAYGMPIYAECGGLMYLCKEIHSQSREVFPGAGLVPAKAIMGKKLAGLGYVKAKLLRKSILGDAGLELRGHEFHWSSISELQDGQAFTLTGGRGQDNRPDGYIDGNILATYVHLHFRYNPRAAENFLTACAQYQGPGENNGQFK